MTAKSLQVVDAGSEGDSLDSAQSLLKHNAPNIDSVFRSEAWIAAWLETYGALPGVEIIDVFDRGRIEEFLYRFPTKIFKSVHTHTLGLAGCQAPGFSSPRSEYNLPAFMCDTSFELQAWLRSLGKLRWSLFTIPDIQFFEELEYDSSFLELQDQVSQSVVIADMGLYLDSIGRNTRSRYFNKMSRLTSDYEVEWCEIPAQDFERFAKLLNQFHIVRWGQPCYSALSIAMMKSFACGLESQGGTAVLEVMKIDGRPKSVIFDVVWAGRRYNLQAGFDQSFSSQLKLGSLHLGRAITQSAASGLVYDFLAGQGKNVDYKAKLSNAHVPLHTFSRQRALLSVKYWLKKYVFSTPV